MKTIGTGMRKVNEQSQERIQCHILEIGKYRQQNNTLKYEVFWDGYPPTFQQLTNLQGCKQRIKQIFTERKTKTIQKRRPAFPTHLKKYISNSQPNNHWNRTPYIQIDCESQLQKSEEKVQYHSQSLASQEGELKLQDLNFNNPFTIKIKNESYEDEERKCQNEKYIEFVKVEGFLSNHELSEGLQAEKKTEKHEKSTIYYSKKEQNQFENAQFQSVLSSEKSRNMNEIMIQKEKQQKSKNFKISKQSGSQILTKPIINKNKNKANTSIENIKQKPVLKIKKSVFNISIPPFKKEQVFVTKCLREGKNLFFEIMTYDLQGFLISRRISHHELTIKAPYALLKFYESRIIY